MDRITAKPARAVNVLRRGHRLMVAATVS